MYGDFTRGPRIINDEVRGEFRLLQFDVRPVPPKLESSARVNGPYAEEASAVADRCGKSRG